MTLALNLQDMATRNNRFVGSVRTITTSVAQTIAVDYFPTLTAPLAQHSIVGHSARVGVAIIVIPLSKSCSILPSESSNGLSLVNN